MLHKEVLPNPLPNGITIGDDGKLRWSYTLNLWRQPVILYAAFKAVKKQNLIRVNGIFINNRIYVTPEQFNFV